MCHVEVLVLVMWGLTIALQRVRMHTDLTGFVLSAGFLCWHSLAGNDNFNCLLRNEHHEIEILNIKIFFEFF